MNDHNVKKLQEIFVTILELDQSEDVSKVERINAVRWDSLAQTSLIAAMESEFGLNLSIPDMERITSFAAARLLLSEKGF
jgi:acyl carrier protein